MIQPRDRGVFEMVKALSGCTEQQLWSALSAGGLVAYPRHEMLQSLGRLVVEGHVAKREGRWCFTSVARGAKARNGSAVSGQSALLRLARTSGIHGAETVKGKQAPKQKRARKSNG